jgi:hypothetical protein
VWGWSFAAHRDVTEFVDLAGVDRAGLDVTGSGLLDVTTAPLYDAGADYLVKQDAAPARTVSADDGGRLHFTVDLGPAHTQQQTAFDDAATAGWAHAHVAIATPATAA